MFRTTSLRSSASDGVLSPVGRPCGPGAERLTGAVTALFVGVCAGAPSLTLDLGPGWLRVGDMMVDGVTPEDGLRPLGLSRPSPGPGRQGHAGSWPRFIG